MKISGRFEELNENIATVLTRMISSQNLCKFLYYNSTSPLSESDISDTKVLLNKNIYPIPIIPSVQDEVKSFIIVTLDDFAKKRDFKTGKIVFDVLCHIDLWKISEGKLRPFSIMNEIDMLFNGQRVLGIGKLEFDSCRKIAVNEKFLGYQLRYLEWERN